MYVGTIIEYDDQSAITSLPITEVRQQPLYLSLFTSDRGPEDWTVTSGEDWFSYYGNSISFAKHGQPLLQAAISINAGAKLLSKRLVADDATLANIGIIATVEKEETEDGGAVAKITYTAASAEGVSANDPKAVFDAINETLTDGQYLLYVITDNGRGVSNKRIMIVPNYRLSKTKTYVEYDLAIYENGVSLESMSFNPIPSLVINSYNHSLQSVVATNSMQVRCVQSDEGITNFINAIAEITGESASDIQGMDFLFGCSKKGKSVDYISISEDGINLQSAYGQALTGGTNGSFGDSPISVAEGEEVDGQWVMSEYETQAYNALGVNSRTVYDTSIYNLDQYKIDICVDANYPTGVKRAIETLVTFREDFVFLRDFGLGLNSLELIQEYDDALEVNNKFISDYPISYDVIDPYSKKQISVTVGFTTARLLVDHLNAGRIQPVCGIKFNMILDDAIPGTLNFTPAVCPDPEGNQKETMEDLRLNYATYIGDDLVLETEYTSQDAYTQFSFLNNILGVQEVVRAIRTRCPAIRYSFIDGEDLDRYKADIEDVISGYSANFKTLEFNYVADPIYTNNKIFYAALNVGFRDFVQTEWFKVTAINVTES